MTTLFRGAVAVAALLLVLAVALTGAPSFPIRGDADYRTVVIFRNDDLEPGNSDDLRRTVDRIFLEEEVPLTNAVVPTSGGEPIDRNEPFCRELRAVRDDNPGRIEYALHGYLHDESDTGFYSDRRDDVLTEFGGLPYDEQHRRIAEGNAILTRCLGEPPASFVPPYGTYDENTVRALAAENVTVVSADAWFTDLHYGESSVFETEGVLHVPRTGGFVEDWETYEFYDRRALQSTFDDAYRNGDLYVHVLHYWTFDTTAKQDRLRSFLEYVESHDGVLFLTVGEFSDAYRDGRLERVDGGWNLHDGSTTGEPTSEDGSSRTPTVADERRLDARERDNRESEAGDGRR